jgi:hypothetical protein
MLYGGRATDALHERPECNLCSKRAIADAKTTRGPWAYLCPMHYLELANGLGVGRGQYLLCGDDLDVGLRALLENESLAPMPECYWGDQSFGSYSGRVPSTGEYIGPYECPEELAREIELADTEGAMAIDHEDNDHDDD